MKRALLAFFGGVGTALAIAAIGSGRAQRAARLITTLDLNTASAEDFVALGLSSELAERIVENRPYRKNIELLERYVLGRADYEHIRKRVGIDLHRANEAVKIAS